MEYYYKKAGLLILLLATSLFSFSQKNIEETSDFDKRYYVAATSLSATDIKKALEVADSLYKNANGSLEEIKSLMLLAMLNEKTGSVSNALGYAIKAEKIATQNKNLEWQTRISGFLSTTFRGIGLNEEGSKYLQKAENANTGSNASPLVEGFIHQEKAYYNEELGEYRAAIEETILANKSIENLPDQPTLAIFRATSFQIAGNCYLSLGEFKKAQNNLNTSLNILGSQETELKGFIFNDLGKIALAQNKLPLALDHYTKALSYAEVSGNNNLKLHIYKNFAEYYKTVNEPTKSVEFHEKYFELMEKQSAFLKVVSNQLIKDFQYEFVKKDSNQFSLMLFTLAIVCAFIFYVYFSRRARRKTGEKYRQFIDKLKHQRTLTMFEEAQDEDMEEDSLSEDIFSTEVAVALPEKVKISSQVMPIETEERILKDLKKLEKREFYLQNDISLSSLSTKMQTNTKYLSYVINKHKGKDINNYVNELRINYIIEKLNNNPHYLDYKISYLAQECGFSSHSKFTAVFTGITGISPSAFIHYIKTDSNILE